MKFQFILNVTNIYIQELSLSICLCVTLIVCMSVCGSVCTAGGVYNKGWGSIQIWDANDKATLVK